MTWQSYQAGNYDIYARLYHADGTPRTGEFRVNTYTTDNQVDASVAMDAAGDFVVAWQSYGQDGSGYGIYAQRYNAAGVAQGSEFQVNTYTTGNQAYRQRGDGCGRRLRHRLAELWPGRQRLRHLCPAL